MGLAIQVTYGKSIVTPPGLQKISHCAQLMLTHHPTHTHTDALGKYQRTLSLHHI